jgi:hypothetical protein
MGQFEYPRIIELTLHRKDRARYRQLLDISKNVLDAPCVDSNPEISITYRGLGASPKINWG